MTKFFAAALAVAGIAGAQTLIDGPKPTGPRMVLVDVMVTDVKDVPVKSLKAENFVLEDNGKKQTLALFDVTDAKTVRSTGIALPGGVVANKQNAKGETASTAPVLLYDRINSDALDQAFVRKQILSVLAGLKPGDHLGFYSIGLNGLQIVNDYDEDAALLAKAAKALSLAETVPADFSNTEKLMFNALVQSLSPTQEMQNQGRVSITYPAFQAMARHIAGVLGRKSLMWITSAFPVTYGNSTERRQDDQKELDRFIRVLSENNIVTYTIDPSGTGSTEMSGQEGLGATRGGSFVQRGAAPSANEGVILATELGTPRNAAGTGSMNQTDTSLTGTQALQTITDKTGGKSYRNGNDISIALREVLSASEYIYTLGFYPDAASLNGSDRDLKVTLTKTDIKAKITNRKHYYAWGPNLSKDLRDVPEMQKLLDQRVPATRVGLLASARPEAPESGKTVVDVVVSGGDLRFDPVGDRWKGDFEMVIIAAGTNVQSSMTYPLDFSQQEMKIAVERGIPIRQVLQTGSQEGAFYIALIDNKSGNAGSTVLPFKAAATAPAAPVIMPATAPVVTPGAPPQR